jgi:hypothetical protein
MNIIHLCSCHDINLPLSIPCRGTSLHQSVTLHPALGRIRVRNPFAPSIPKNRGSCATPTRVTTCPQRSPFTTLYHATRHICKIQGRILPLGNHVSPAPTLLTQSEFNVHAWPFQESRRGGQGNDQRRAMESDRYGTSTRLPDPKQLVFPEPGPEERVWVCKRGFCSELTIAGTRDWRSLLKSLDPGKLLGSFLPDSEGTVGGRL